MVSTASVWYRLIKIPAWKEHLVGGSIRRVMIFIISMRTHLQRMILARWRSSSAMTIHTILSYRSWTSIAPLMIIRVFCTSGTTNSDFKSTISIPGTPSMALESVSTSSNAWTHMSSKFWNSNMKRHAKSVTKLSQEPKPRRRKKSVKDWKRLKMPRSSPWIRRNLIGKSRSLRHLLRSSIKFVTHRPKTF